ncbi:imm11 family protein [Hyalangium rubrum]|uniref:Immunity MXAN-0049 protein domain-containing protein n=1 Tax=Hyalangium rubrum TaxID=3103134 RepID=A0ABU5H5F8_9BACT|nr:DUF1629 domain-containing protein [Hyalangium sp. s54d21]MDY7227320.1 hypothetical protein [Hyalangium sp. s54d21]
MPQHFFKLYDDVYVPRRWHLATPTDGQGREVDDWQFTEGRALRIEGRLKIRVEHAGRPLDFAEAGLKIPVVHVKVASLFTELAPQDVQLIPVDIEGQPDQYLILVATRCVRCIDEKASRIRLWTHEDGVPEKVGRYRDVRDMRIDQERVGDAKVFRPWGWEGTLIVSGDIKSALTRMGAAGPKFTGV